jgi:hypothetical protein
LTLNNDSILPNIEELQKTTETLLEQYKSIKSKENNSNKEQPDISQGSSKKWSSSKKQAINTISLSPEETKKAASYGADNGEIGKNLFLFAENLQDVSQASISERTQNNNNASTSSPPTTIVINKPSQPPAVSARSISSVSNAGKKTSASEQMSNEKRQPSIKSYSNDDFEEEEEDDDDGTENLPMKKNFMKKSTLSREDFEDDGVEIYNEEDDDF